MMSKYTKQSREKMVAQYVKAGYPLIPLKGKVPLVKAWQKTKYDPCLTLDKLGGGNFGVVLKDDDLVLDVDPRNFKNGINSLRSLMRDIEMESCNTFIVRTGSGGLHIYMKKPPNILIHTKLPEYPGIEFKTKGAQLVGATCVHPNTGKTYDVMPGILHIDDVEGLLA